MSNGPKSPHTKIKTFIRALQNLRFHDISTRKFWSYIKARGLGESNGIRNKYDWEK